jgi:hypothetical protein
MISCSIHIVKANILLHYKELSFYNIGSETVKKHFYEEEYTTLNSCCGTEIFVPSVFSETPI